MKIFGSLFVFIFLVGCGGSTSENVSIKGAGISLSSSNSVVDPGVFAATNEIDPDVVKIKVYKVAFSFSEECTDLQTVFDNGDSPETKNFLDSPTLGSGSLDDGTYNCVVIEMSDQVTFSPVEDSDTVVDSNPICEDAKEYTIDVCRADNGDAETTKLIDGTTVNCAGDQDTKVNDRIAIYISTLSTTEPLQPGKEFNEEANAFIAPTQDSKEDGFKLENALVVSGSSEMSFVADFTGRVAEEGGNTCGVESPNWGFQ